MEKTREKARPSYDFFLTHTFNALYSLDYSYCTSLNIKNYSENPTRAPAVLSVLAPSHFVRVWESCMSTLPSSLELSGKRQGKYCIISSKCVLKSSKPGCHSLNLRKPGTLSLTTDAHNAPGIEKVLKSSTTQKVLVLKWTQIIYYIFFLLPLKSTNWNSFQSMRPASLFTFLVMAQ